jgi:hypothetical protein
VDGREKKLSMGGKEMPIKAVAQAIPVFAMKIFNIPKKICHRISQLWWVMNMTIRRCIGWHGGKCVSLNKEEAWGFETYILLVPPCW